MHLLSCIHNVDSSFKRRIIIDTVVHVHRKYVKCTFSVYLTRSWIRRKRTNTFSQSNRFCQRIESIQDYINGKGGEQKEHMFFSFN